MTLPGGDSDPPGPRRETVVAGRYRLDRVLGTGSFGKVWSADDVVTGRRVAVKLLHSDARRQLSRAQLEVMALRQKLPGVVELLDDGIEDERAFLVMELVEGRPFPGADAPRAWTDIADVVVSLLSTLGRVHASFIVHRDLKPANVLVTADRQVKILDFGIAHRPAALDNDSAEGIEILGTPAYMAPEQLQGRRTLTERTDIYAVGLMLYEALAGRLPHEGRTPGQMLWARLNRPPLPLAQCAPAVPPNVARLVERMLAPDPADRPATAFEVLGILRGEKAVEDPFFLWLGSQAPLDAALGAARARRSLDIAGQRGSGRTRTLLAARDTLSGSLEIHWIEPARRPGRPLESLAPVTGPLDVSTDERVPAAEIEAAERVRAAVGRGAVLLVDDFADLDSWSKRILESARASGTVIRAIDESAVAAGEDTARLRPLSEADLRSLFAGPDRLLHLREDGARVLHERTGGIPSRVVREVSSWLHLGIARSTRNLLVVPRDALDRLSAGLLGGELPTEDAAALWDLPVSARDMLVWATLSWPGATTALLGEVTGLAVEDVRADIDLLATRGLVRTLPEGRVAAVAPLSSAAWGEKRLRQAHAAIAAALSPGSPGRLLHLVLAGSEDDSARLAIAREAIALAARLVGEGRLGAAVPSVESGLRAARELGPAGASETAALFVLWAEAAFDEGTPQAVDRLLHALYRADDAPALDVLKTLALAMKVEQFESERALSLARSVPPQDDPRLERLRVRALVNAARVRRDDAAEERLLDELSASSAVRDPENAARIEHARGRLRYRQARFADAAALHERAARQAASLLHRIEAMNAGAWALLEAFELDHAEVLAAEARALAAEHRHAMHEASATWSLRAIAYRKGTAGKPDMELVAAVQYAAGKQLQGAIAFTEAAVAWRSGAASARQLARMSHHLLSGIDERRGALLMRCLLAALGEAIDETEVKSLHETALSLRGSGIALQALALLAMAGRLPADAVPEELLGELAGETPRAHWGVPADILSVEESVAAIRGVRGTR